MCCEADWKREVVHDHKWDFINVAEFHRTDLWTRLKYVFRYILLFKSLAVMGLDIFTAITMVSSNHWTNALTQKAANSGSGIDVQFAIAKWVFVGCIIFSFLLYGYEFYKAKLVIQSRDIAYGFTNLQANDYFSFKNYDNFCLFCHIESSTKRKDDFAFFIFFTFKDWKRLLLADGPRQSINALMLYSFGTANGWQTYDIPAWWDREPVTAMLLFAMISTVLIFAGSLMLLIAASILYMPLLCYIQGNLKEYVCVKVDKRLEDLIKKKQRQRAQRAAALEKKLARDGGLRNSKGEFVNVVLQPTLPKINLSDDDLSIRGASGAAGSRMARSKSGDTLAGYGKQDHGYPPSLDYDYPSTAMYGRDDFTNSTTRLTDAAGPMGISYPPITAPPAAAPSFPPPSSYPARGPSPTNRVVPSRSQTQLSGMSGMSGTSGYSQNGYPPSNAYGSHSQQNLPQRQASHASHSAHNGSSQFRSSPPYPPSQSSRARSYQSHQPYQQPNQSQLHQSQSQYQNHNQHHTPHQPRPDAYSQPSSSSFHLAPLTSQSQSRHQGDTVLSPSTYTTSHTSHGPSQIQSDYLHGSRRISGGSSGGASGTSGLAYDRPDTDAFADADADAEDPAPSYYSGSPPRRAQVGHGQIRGQGQDQGYGGSRGYGPSGNVGSEKGGWR